MQYYSKTESHDYEKSNPTQDIGIGGDTQLNKLSPGRTKDITKSSPFNPFDKKTHKSPNPKPNGSLKMSGSNPQYDQKNNKFSMSKPGRSANSNFKNVNNSIKQAGKRKGYSKPRTGHKPFPGSKRGTTQSFLSQSMAYSTGKLYQAHTNPQTTIKIEIERAKETLKKTTEIRDHADT